MSHTELQNTHCSDFHSRETTKGWPSAQGYRSYRLLELADQERLYLYRHRHHLARKCEVFKVPVLGLWLLGDYP